MNSGIRCCRFAGESHLLAHPHLLPGRKFGLSTHPVLRAAAETGLLASYDPVLLAYRLRGC
jgi:hypothetical protein